MNALKILRSLGPVDLKSVRRDSLLRWMVLFPILIALGVRWGLPFLSGRLAAGLGFDLSPYNTVIASILLVTVVMMLGMVVGFLLLDQRDDQTLVALQVTPLSLNGYFLYRIGMPLVLSVLITILVMPLTGLIEVGFLPLLAIAIEGAPLAPLFALALGSFAENKVQGFALTKASGVLFLAPLVAYFVPSGWQVFFGIVPTYWPAKLYWMFHSGEPWVWAYFLAGLAYQALLLFLLVRRFNRVMSR